MTRRIRISIAAILVACVTPTGAATKVLRVPGEHGTIQAAIDAASAGDEILVSPGTYFENLVMKSGVTLASEAGPRATTIDGSRSGSVIDCVGTSSETVIRGFHITGGSGTPISDSTAGGGIRCWSSASPLIENNIFTENAASLGGAIGCRYGSVPLIRHNRFLNNHADREGGGVYAIDGSGGTIIIEHNSFRGNSADATSTSSGGGVWLGGIHLEVRDNRFRGNSTRNGGGGLWVGFAGDKVIERNVFHANRCENLGGGVWLSEGTSRVEGNTFYGNAAPFGGAIGFGGRGSHDVRRNILAASREGSGLYCTGAGGVSLECNNIWRNAGGNTIPECLTDLGGNFHRSPRFCDPRRGDFDLSARSPCRPAGNSCHEWIGAKRIGCRGPSMALAEPRSDVVSIQPSTWGRIKAAYRD